MKNLIIFIVIAFNLFLPALSSGYKVLRVSDGDTIYLDFNNNGMIEKSERVRLNGIDAFEVHNSEHLKNQMKKYGFSLEQVLILGYLGGNFASKELYGQNVEIKYSSDNVFDKYGRPIVSIYYDNGKNYEKEILKAGYAVVYSNSNLASNLKKYENLKKIKLNLKKAKNINLVFYNSLDGKYYPLNSKEAFSFDSYLINLNDK